MTLIILNALTYLALKEEKKLKVKKKKIDFPEMTSQFFFFIEDYAV